MKRYDIINKYIEKYNYKTYLEIGTRKNHTFNKINIHKTSVDPDIKAEADYQITSDEFFAQVHPDKKFDIIFIDGDHNHKQVLKDIENSLRHLSHNGTIIMHDCNPTSFRMQHIPRMQVEWTGDVWKAFVHLRRFRSDLELFVIDTDYGCGVVRRGFDRTLKWKTIYNYEGLDKSRKEWLSLISVDEWLKKLEDEL